MYVCLVSLWMLRTVRFTYVACGGSESAGLTVGVTGTPGQALTLTAVDPHGVAHVTTVTLPAQGFVVVNM